MFTKRWITFFHLKEHTKEETHVGRKSQKGIFGLLSSADTVQSSFGWSSTGKKKKWRYRITHVFFDFMIMFPSRINVRTYVSLWEMDDTRFYGVIKVL